MTHPPRALLEHLARVFENTIALAQEGEAYLTELRNHLEPQHFGSATIVGRPTLLLVDDDGALLRSLARDLGKVFAVSVADTGEQALELLESQTFDAVVCDFHLGDISGIRVLTGAAQLIPTAVRILYTGAATEAEVVRRGLKSGLIHRLLAKPVATSEMLACIAEELAKERE